MGEEADFLALGLCLLASGFALVLALRGLLERRGLAPWAPVRDPSLEAEFDAAFASLPRDRRRDLIALEMRRLRTRDRAVAMRSLLAEKSGSL